MSKKRRDTFLRRRRTNKLLKNWDDAPGTIKAWLLQRVGTLQREGWPFEHAEMKALLELAEGLKKEGRS